MSEMILDASALIAVLAEEAGSERVEPHLYGAAISCVNLSEVIAKFVDKGLAAKDAAALTTGLGLDVHPFDEPQAVRAGQLRTATRALGLGLGDRACLALALELGRPVLTADREWSRLRLGIEIHSIR